MFGERNRSRLSRISAVAVFLVITNANIAQGLARSRYPISESDIAKELDAIGINVTASQVHLPAHMSSAISSPKLEIVTAQPLGADQVRIELRCTTAEGCLPFFAVVDVEDAKLAIAEVQSKKASVTPASHPARGRIVTGAVSRPQLKVGSHAVMTIRDGHLDIHLQVLAIDSGAIGQQVRVCTLDRKTVFHATVTGEDTVTGEIE